MPENFEHYLRPEPKAIRHGPVAEDGTMTGDRIPNSVLFRHFCSSCGEAMRCAGHRVVKPVCDSCQKSGRSYVPEVGRRKRRYDELTDDSSDGWQANVISDELEDKVEG